MSRKQEKRKAQARPTRGEGSKAGVPLDTGSSIAFVDLQNGKKRLLSLSDEDREAMLERISDKASLKEEIDRAVAGLREMLTGYDPLWILGDLCAHFYLRFGRDIAPTDPQAAGAPKYFASLLLAQEYPHSPKRPNSDLLDELISAYGRLVLLVDQFYMPTVGPEDSSEKGLQYLFRLHTVHVHGKFYWPIAKRYFEGLAKEIDPMVLGSVGFGIGDVIKLLGRAEQQVLDRISSEMSDLRVLKEGHNKFIEFQKAEGRKYGTPEELAAGYWEWLGVDLREEMDAAARRLAGKSSAEYFELSPDNEVELRIVKCLSVRFGENRDFLERFPESSGWPLSPSRIPEKPFIEHGGRYYLLPGGSVFQDFDEVVNGLIDGLPDSLRERAFRMRDQFLERTATSVLKGVFGEHQVFENVYYPCEGLERHEDAEVDAIVVFGDVVVIIEAKAGRLHGSSRRGGVEKIRKDLSNLIVQGYEQGLRTKAYIEQSGKAKFTDGRGNQVLEVVGDRTKRFYVVNVTNDPLFPVQADPKYLTELGLVASHESLLSFSIYDLIVIAEILERPSFFLDYIDKRTRISQRHFIEISDEMNGLGLYVSGRLEVTDEMEHLDLVAFNGAGVEIDKYYYLLDASESVTKPRVTLPGKFDGLLRCIEASESDVKGTVALKLLETRPGFQKKVAYKERDAIKKKKTRTIRETAGNCGLVLMVRGDDWDDSAILVEAKRVLSRTGIEECYVIHWAPEIPDTEVTCARIGPGDVD